MDKYLLYVAYGSNLNLAQMKRRCPMAEVYGAGRIQNYRLAFKTMGTYAYATIEPCAGENVPVAVWRLGRRDEASLDRYEGYPIHYVKRTVEVVLEDGAVVEGMVYVMNDMSSYALPTLGYLECILEGYGSFRFDVHKLYEAWHRAGADSGQCILKHYREQRGITQVQLAEMTGIPVKSIRKYESGERSIQRAGAGYVLRLARALGASPYLLAY